MSTPSVQLSSRTWPIWSVRVQLGSGPISLSEPKLRVASGSQEDPGHRRAEQETPRETPLTTEALAARGDSLQHLRKRVAVSIPRSACPASSSMAVGGSEHEDKLRRRMDEYLLHEEYYKSVRGEDGEEPLEALGYPPQTDMGSFYYSGPPTDLADTVSLPRRPRGSGWRPELPATIRTPEVCPAYVEDSHLPGPTYGALDRTAELLAKLLSGSEDPDVTALSEAVRAKLGITEPLPKPALAPPSPGLSMLADDLKQSRVSRLLPKVTCPSPFHPRARTVPIAELQDVTVTETEKKGLTALATLAGRLPPLQTQPQGVRRVANQLPRRTSSWSRRSSTLKTCPSGQRNSPSFFYSPANLMWMWPLNLRRLKLHGRKRQKVPKIHGLKKHQKNHSLACKKSSRFSNTERTLM